LSHTELQWSCSNKEGNVHHNLSYKLGVKYRLNFGNVCPIFEVVNLWVAENL
jgi:hypothetical protein